MTDTYNGPQSDDDALLLRVMVFLADEGWPAERVGEQLLVHTRFQGQSGQ